MPHIFTVTTYGIQGMSARTLAEVLKTTITRQAINMGLKVEETPTHSLVILEKGK